MRKIPRALLWLGITYGVVSCGGASETTAIAKTLSFDVTTITLHPGELDTIKVFDGGASVPGPSLRWFTTSPAIAVADAGIITGVAPGTATISGVSVGREAKVLVTVLSDMTPGTFTNPLGSSVPVVSVFDHNLPFEFADTNGFLLSFWGEKVGGIDGHNGYDWLVPEGTPVLAAGAGTITFAGDETPFSCPLLKATVGGRAVNLMHGLTTGEVVVTTYAHLSRIDVKVGGRVTKGQQIGLSGNTGCSTTPHLHFGEYRVSAGGYVPSDPYGWQASTDDPWSRDSRGTTSLALWSAATAPALFGELDRPGVYPKPRFVSIKALRYMGIDDAKNLNNEFIEFDVNPDFASWSFSRDTVRNAIGPVFVFPAGFQVAGGSSVRVYSGAGTNTASVLYMGQTTPVWNNRGDCAVLVDTLKRVLDGLVWQDGTCGASSAAVRRARELTADRQAPLVPRRPE